MKNPELKQCTVTIPNRYYMKMKALIKEGRYVSMAEIIREALSLWENQTRMVHVTGVESDTLGFSTLGE